LTTINESNCLEFTARLKACPSWPVRIAGMQGLWRYVGPLNSESVEVIGPYFPNNPDRNGGRSRIFKVNQIKYAGKSAKPVDVLNVASTALSDEAKRARRR
jgi:hypothetical protein